MRDKLLTIQEVAAYLRLNRFTVYRLAESGNLPGFKVTDQWRFKERELKIWLEKRKNHKRSKGRRS